MITLMNLRKEKPSQPYDVKVDRTSVLGNPYHGDREDTCDKYAEYFPPKTKNDLEFARELRKIIALHKQYGQVRLFCWCVPLRCHSETIKSFLEGYV
jgi:hypothetical protein